jgi:hypothetical protein
MELRQRNPEEQRAYFQGYAAGTTHVLNSVEAMNKQLVEQADEREEKMNEQVKAEDFAAAAASFAALDAIELLTDQLVAVLGKHKEFLHTMDHLLQEAMPQATQRMTLDGQPI